MRRSKAPDGKQKGMEENIEDGARSFKLTPER